MGRRVAQESLIDKASKILSADFNDVSMVVTDEALIEERKTMSEIRNKDLKEIKKRMKFGLMLFHLY